MIMISATASSGEAPRKNAGVSRMRGHTAQPPASTPSATTAAVRETRAGRVAAMKQTATPASNSAADRASGNVINQRPGVISAASAPASSSAKAVNGLRRSKARASSATAAIAAAAHQPTAPA